MLNYIIRFFVVIVLITCDAWLSVYVPKQAKLLLNQTLSGTIIVVYGVTVYVILRFTASSIRYINDLVFFPIINNSIRFFKLKICTHIAQLPFEEALTINPAVIVSRFWRLSLGLSSSIVSCNQ